MTSTRYGKTGANKTLTSFGRAREGGVAVTVALSIAVLVGSAASALDLGRLYNAVTELDNAADAAAIAAASQLSGTPNSCARAIAAATDTFLLNTETFADNANDPGGPPVFIDATTGADWHQNTNIRFLSALVKDVDGNLIGDYIDSALGPGEQGQVTTDITVCDTQADFVEVTVDQASPGHLYVVVFDFAQVVGAVGQAHPRGYAVAGIGRFFCGATPMMMCEFRGNPPAGKELTFDDLEANVEKYRGRGIWLKSARNNVQWGPGNFGFLAPEGSCGNGAACLRDNIGQADPDLACIGLENLTTEPGNSSGARHGFNTRFGIYQGGGIDSTDANWQPAAVTTHGKVRRNSNCGLSSWEDPAVTYNGVGSIDPARSGSGVSEPFSNPLVPMASGTGMGLPLDDCAYGGTCTGTDTGTFWDRLGDNCDDGGKILAGDAGNCWDIEAYLKVNHDKARTGLENDLAPMARPSDGRLSFEEALRNDPYLMPPAGGGPRLTRFDGRIARWMVYHWELGYSGSYDATEYGSVDMGEGDFHVVDNLIFTPEPAPPCATPGDCPQMLPEPLSSFAPPPTMPSPGHADEYGGPHQQCYSGPMGNVFSTSKGGVIDMDVDRRVIEVVMVNCDPNDGGYDIRGRTTGIDGEGFVQMFVLEPWRVNGNEHQIYTEIIGPVNKDIEKTRAAEIVQLYE